MPFFLPKTHLIRFALLASVNDGEMYACVMWDIAKFQITRGVQQVNPKLPSHCSQLL